MSNIEENLGFILSSRYGKDVRQAIHDAIHDCYEDGKAGATDLIAREQIVDTDEKLSAQIVDTDEKLSAQIVDTDEKLSAQIANLVANAPSGSEKDSELVDIRVGYEGTTYTSAGEAVRGQVGKLSEDLNSVCENIGFYIQNIFDYTDVTTGKSINTTIGSDINNFIDKSTAFVSNQIWKVKKGDKIYVSIGYGKLGVYNSEGTLVEQFSNSGDTHFEVTNDEAKMLRYSSNISTGYLEKFMLCINHELPGNYVAYNESISDVDNIKISVEENKSEIENIKNDLNPDKKAIIILDFDQAIEENDNRISIMNTYGWKPSFIGGITSEITKKLLADGWDLSTYWNASNVPTDAQLSGSDVSDFEACKLYVKTGLESQEENGFFNPISWSCRQNKYGETLGKALKFYGYKICRGGGNDGFSQDINEDFTRTNATGIYSNNLSNVKVAIDTAISNKQAINIFTHFVVDTIGEDRGYDCLKSVYIELMNYIKSKVDGGLCVVMNYREFYQKAFPETSYEIDYERNIKRMNFIESKIS